MYKRIIYTILLSLTVILSVGCKKKDTIKIGVSQCSSDDWRTKMNEEIKREIMFHPGAEVEIRSAEDSNDKQIADIRYFMDNDFDIIVAAPREAEAITPIIKEAYSKNIPVVVFDRDIEGNTYTARQVVDNEGIGHAAAKYAASITDSTANVIEIFGLHGSSPAMGRHKGFSDEAKELGLNILCSAQGNWNYDDAKTVTDSLLKVYPDVDLIYAHNDRMAIAAADVADSLGRKDIKVLGIDAAPEIGIKAVAEGKIDATFLYPTDGHRLIRTALAIIEGKPYEKDLMLPFTHSAVDRTNADILLRQNEDLKQETSRIERLKTQIDDYWSQHSLQTSLFYATIAILVLTFGIVFMLLRAYWSHKKHQRILMEQNKLLEQQRDNEKALNEQIKTITQSKLMFFTNVSHDLRTPLTLIAEPVEQLAAADNLTPAQRTMVKIAGKNVKILKRLINQILDFRKYENGKLDLHLANVCFPALVRDWSEAFNVLALKRNIKLTINIDLPDDFVLAIDVEKVERVFFNLMSNAFKYTPDNGKIRFECAVHEGNLVFSVLDTGKGISNEDLLNIFTRFYQVDKVHPNGSGIGLSLVKAFIELHGGTIIVDSELDKGSVFTVTLPVTKLDTEAVTTSDYVTTGDIEQELCKIARTETSNDESLPLLLIIDDNSDIRLMISELLKDSYRIMEASNGKEGLRLASKYVPDLIICDVMMPVMDGLECCRILKTEVSTSHIPVLMLTACTMEEQRMQGYESGADGYLAKPFNSKMLRLRVENLISNRKRIKELWSKSASVKVQKEEASDKKPVLHGDIDNEFYQRFLTLFSKEMGNADMNIDALASKLGIGRSQFYRKIKALTNYSPVELVRKLRLEKARELLTGSEQSISEIAYAVGFSSPAYFTRVYRETYGETPSELRERLGHK